MQTRQALLFSLVVGLLSGCASVSPRSDITELNRIYRLRAKQTLYAIDARSRVTTKRLSRPASAVLYEREDTLYAEFVPTTLPPVDNDPKTIDRADSLATLFWYYNRRVDFLEEKSPWFYYQLTTFDVDLFTIPFKYRFPTPGRPGELSTSANLGVYIGIRYDLGRYRNIYLWCTEENLGWA